MKLTKGKLTKLYGKKRQSRKRYKKNKGETQSKTFRKRRFLDMHNRTLKHMLYGGANTNVVRTTVANDPLSPSSNPLSSTSSLLASTQSSTPTNEQLSSKSSSSTLPLYPLSATNEQLSSEPSQLVTIAPSIQTPLSSNSTSQSGDSGEIEMKELNIPTVLKNDQGELETDVEEEKQDKEKPSSSQPSLLSSPLSEEQSMKQRESKLHAETASDGSLIALKDNIALATVIPPYQQYDTDDSTFALGRAVEALADYMVKRILNASPSVAPLVSAAEKQAEQAAIAAPLTSSEDE